MPSAQARFASPRSFSSLASSSCSTLRRRSSRDFCVPASILGKVAGDEEDAGRADEGAFAAGAASAAPSGTSKNACTPLPCVHL